MELTHNWPTPRPLIISATLAGASRDKPKAAVCPLSDANCDCNGDRYKCCVATFTVEGKGTPTSRTVGHYTHT